MGITPILLLITLAIAFFVVAYVCTKSNNTQENAIVSLMIIIISLSSMGLGYGSCEKAMKDKNGIVKSK